MRVNTFKLFFLLVYRCYWGIFHGRYIIFTICRIFWVGTEFSWKQIPWCVECGKQEEENITDVCKKRADYDGSTKYVGVELLSSRLIDMYAISS